MIKIDVSLLKLSHNEIKEVRFWTIRYITVGLHSWLIR